AQSPFSTHADSIKRAENQQPGVIRRKRREQLHERLENDVDNKGDASSEQVAEQSEDERAQGSHGQRKRDCVGQLGDARPKIACHWHDHEREKEKIECIEYPSQEASQERVSLIAIERPEELHRLHGALS